MTGVIFGWIGQTPRSTETLAAMLRETSGTGADASSVQFSGDENLGLGTSSRSATPHGDESAGIFATIEGTPIWQEPDLRAIALQKGHSTALVQGYQRFGPRVLEKLGGAFACCIAEPQRHYALLAIDRIGICPLAYTVIDGQLIFGSQATSILAHPAVRSRVAPQGLFDYLYFHMVPSPTTVFEGIEKLGPGEYLEFQGGKATRGAYWHVRFSESSASESELAGELQVQLDQSVKDCLSDQPTGAFLSGGLDSSTVTGVFQNLSDKPVDAFAIGFDAEGFDEMEYARASARHFGAKLHEYYVTPKDVLDALPLIAGAYDEPFGNASAIPAYYCAKFARESGIECLLAGDGGDEIFGGNARYAKQKLFDLYYKVPAPLRKLLIDPLARDIGPLRKLKSYVEQARVPMPERMETYNFLHRTPLAEIFAPDFLGQVDSDHPAQLLKERYDQAGTDSLLKQMLYLDHKITLSDNDLRKVNRMCELAGMEVRYPLLQDGMMEFAAKVPSDMLLKGQELRSFYRRALKDFLAPETLSKDKHGFGLPFGLWLNEYAPLKEFADESLKSIRQRGFLQDEYIDTLIQAHQSGHASYYGVMIWILVMLEQWLQTHQLDIG